MYRFAKYLFRRQLRRRGYDIVRFKDFGLGVDSLSDMQKLLADETSPMVFDVGANIGQSVNRFRIAFRSPTIHSFEPSPDAYRELLLHCRSLPDVHVWNCGVGDQDGVQLFHESDKSVMSSLLMPGEACRDGVTRSYEVDVVSIDQFAVRNEIAFIHVLKSDTQGFDLEVLKGAHQLIKLQRIGLLYFEVNFCELYQGQPKVHEMFEFLENNGYSFVSFYEMKFRRRRAAWADALFVCDDFLEKQIARE